MYYKLFFIITAFIAMSGCKPVNKTGNSEQGNKQITSADNSQNSLDWAGVYIGAIPCADCEGIQTEIRLNRDLSYEIATKHAGKGDNIYRGNGYFKWDETGSRIILENTGRPAISADQYQVGENTLTVLDAKGNKVKSTLPAGTYILRKVSSDNSITEKYWKLIELNGKKFILSPNQREPHFILKKENVRVIGFAGCNSFNGTYELSAGNNRLRFSKMVSTMRACMDAHYEKDYLRVLNIVDNYTLRGDTLALNKARMATLAKFVVVYLN